MHDRLRQHVGDADDEPERPAARAPLDALQEFPAQREDLVRVSKRHLTRVGEDQRPPLAQEELLAEDLLEAMDLAADRRVSQVQLGARADDAAFLRHHPEVQKMVVVQPLHGPTEYVGFPDAGRKTILIVELSISPEVLARGAGPRCWPQ